MEKVICIVGPTSVGKSSLGIKLAELYNSEIISGDSIQVYRQLDIGSAKISVDEQKRIKHHLIDILDIDQNYSVYDFQKQARLIFDMLYTQNKIPIVVGGTGLYIKSLIYDYEFSEHKSMINDEAYSLFSNEQLYDILLEKDAPSAKKTHVNNRKRIIRALQIIDHSEITKSEILNKQQHLPIYDAFIIGLTCERSVLYERINQRVDQMMDSGLVEEVKALQKLEGVFGFQGMAGIGYKEFQPYFNKECSLSEVREEIKKHTRNFAKRQYTWFNNQLDVHWYDIFTKDYENQIIEDLKGWLEK